MPLKKAGHPQVTFNSIPPIDFNGCKIRIPLNNVCELAFSEWPSCLSSPTVSKHL